MSENCRKDKKIFWIREKNKHTIKFDEIHTYRRKVRKKDVSTSS